MAPVPLIQDAPRAVAVFDLDGTLVRGDTLLPFLTSFALRRRRPWPLLCLPFTLSLLACRLLGAEAAKSRLLASFLGGRPRDEVSEHADWFCRRWVARNFNDLVVARLREHQDAGHRVVLLSASPDPYVPAIAASLGITEIACTRMAGDPLCWGRTLIGRNCKGEEKMRRLRELLKDTPASEAFAYGDSASDAPVLAWARHGFLVRRGLLVPFPRRGDAP